MMKSHIIRWWCNTYPILVIPGAFVPGAGVRGGRRPDAPDTASREVQGASSKGGYH